ncbi:hypothetical protein ILUMI_13369 [Ignelater luminosus]|uniref:PIN domain-containing protein n=1 Tax=Ignelater luminosus TaxID=2038154 RepID=A0A8K0CXX0_IGNLU|nr:hypothetical protein ILUMI_13369 [Ignelater luminosus]
MRRRARSQHPPPNSLDQLRQSLIRAWEDISQETIRSLTERHRMMQEEVDVQMFFKEIVGCRNVGGEGNWRSPPAGHSQLQDTSGYRSELQERALIISLQMFNLILERCVSILNDHIKSNPDKLTVNCLPQDFHMLLPAVKTWCDWMLCHSSVWNPPPSTQDYRVGPAGDAWSRLASLMNLLEKLDQTIASCFIAEAQDGYEQVRLPEDAVLCGFTPLMYNEHEPTYVPKEVDPEIAQFALRLAKVHFFGTVFLCGLETPVLKLEMDNGFSAYISVVNTSASRDSPPSPPELIDDDDLLVESFSEDEEEGEEVASVNENTSSEVRQLLSRKVELEKRQRTQELHRQRVQKILQQSVVSVQIEIRPKILVPDTNCFIDYLCMIKKIVEVHVYTLMVPLVVLNELEGLGRGGKCPVPSPRMAADPQHVLKVADSAKQALEYLGNRHNNIKCVTTKGTTLPTFTFTSEEDSTTDSTLRNDDKILSTCLVLCKNNKDEIAEGEPRKLYREVVLLTEDRNLRVKALARDLPVRELPDFMQWAGLG